MNKQPWGGIKTKDRERIAVWLDHEALAQLRKWHDHEALNVSQFIRIAIQDAIKRKTRALARPKPPKAQPLRQHH
jgi:hypothetical protein